MSLEKKTKVSDAKVEEKDTTTQQRTTNTKRPLFEDRKRRHPNQQGDFDLRCCREILGISNGV
jgi:hypothetical protein